MKKKSFFELLTGVDDEQPVTTRDDSVADEVAEEELEESLQETTATSKASTSHNGQPVAVDADRGIQPLGDEHEEGQLTIDVYQNPREIVIQSPVAGVFSKDLDVSITNDMVTIKGKRTREEEVTEGDYYFQELYWGSFSRSVILPAEVEANKARASLKNGILTVRLPKVKKEAARKIQIEEL
ncbi:MAG: Protein containing Heat shock protein Hsp20 protein [Parcubacteria group bacterium GW2011_GWA2_47_8]|nr:MAG: Protein containing Heat shock protein Hsp20 protein [Parcubacteria group bacterium GW2011_GWA2_47_8]OHB20514.1 MAG: hypothetical protein A2666_03545 [Parcubacteria group bacterium RIFCSPHIGHO2_01_FULL_47_10b]